MSHCRLGIFIFMLLVSLNAENVLSIFWNSNSNGKKHGRIMKRDYSKNKNKPGNKPYRPILYWWFLYNIQTYILRSHTPYILCVCVSVWDTTVSFGLNILIGIFIKLTRLSHHIGSYRCALRSAQPVSMPNIEHFYWCCTLMSISIRTVNI